MPITQGQGNPDWTRDETILAFDLCQRFGKTIPNSSHNEIQGLSQLLQSIPWPDSVKRTDRFRNAQGVKMKLLNLQSVGTGKGLSKISRMDRIVVAEFTGNNAKLREQADSIRTALRVHANGLSTTYFDFDDEIEHPEGRILTAVHKKRERHPGLRRRLLSQRRKASKLYCEICDWNHGKLDQSYDVAGYEVHHLKPLGMDIAKSTKLADLSLLCARCHRLIHRAIVLEKRWLTIQECTKILRY
jgi:5-methylcytosine-specific restriction enzyme A